MATTGHESESIDVLGLKSSLQKLKTDIIDPKANKSEAVSTIAWSSNKLTKTINGTTSDVVTASTIKTALSLAKGDVGLGSVTNDALVKRTEMGEANGVATLDSTGKVPSTQLPFEGSAITVPCFVNPPVDLRKQNLRVLFIGNSYDNGATAYLSSIISAAGLESNFSIYRCTKSSGKFKDWSDIYKDTGDAYEINHIAGSIISGVSTGSSSANDGSDFRALLDNGWDIISVHQVSDYSNDYNSWIVDDGNAGYLREYLRILRTTNPNATIGFFLPHSYRDNYSGGMSSVERWQAYVAATKKAIINYGFDFVIPEGTAAENLRASSINTYDFSTDGTHLADGIGKYVAACALYQRILAPRFGINIIGNTWRKTDCDETENGVLNVDNTNAPLAQKAAMLACMDMYSIQNPDSVYLPAVGTTTPQPAEEYGQYVPTLAAAPSSYTLTYIKKGTTYNFAIGQFCRVASQEAESGWIFYQLYDINNGSAVWQESNAATPEPGMPYVDLGLTSGKLWAQLNLGASSEEESGLYYSWGNTVGHTADEGYSFTDSSYAGTVGSTINTNISTDSGYDVARLTLGNGWRMPTESEFTELINGTDQELATINGISGLKFMKKTDHNVYIFLPYAKWYNANNNGSLASSTAKYHSATKGSVSSGTLVDVQLHINSSGTPSTANYKRANGCPIRPIKDAE